MDKLEILKKTLQYSASLGAAGIVGTTIKSNIPPASTPIKRYLNLAGVYGLSGLVGGKVHSYIGREFDELVELFREADKQIKEK